MIRQGSKVILLENSVEFHDIDEESAQEDSVDEIKIEGLGSGGKVNKK